MKKPKPKKVAKKKVFRRLPRHDRNAIIEECAKCVPTTWLDPLLSGPDKVGDMPGRATEALLRGIQDRIRKLMTA